MANLRRILVAAPVVFTCVLSLGVHAQTPQTEQKPAVKSVSARPIVSVEGADNFQEYCAVCHGKDAKGDVPDLTLIAKRHDGKFNPVEIDSIITGTGKSMTTPAHGVETMPIWGEVFRENGSADPAVTKLRVRNLVAYLRGIQR